MINGRTCEQANSKIWRLRCLAYVSLGFYVNFYIVDICFRVPFGGYILQYYECQRQIIRS
jgi:hypothetical protein